MFHSEGASVMSTGLQLSKSRVQNQVRVGKSPDCAGWSPAGLTLSARACAAGTVFSVFMSVCGHPRAPILYTARTAGDASPAPSSYWPGSSSASCISMLHRNTFSQGEPTPFNFSTPTCLTMRLIERGSQTFPYEDPHPNTHLTGFYLRDPPWTIDMCCYDLDVVN